MSKQWDAINALLPIVTREKSVKAVFLKGSMARNQDDEYSDVDFYCLLGSGRRDRFLKKRLALLQTYRPLLFSKEVNFGVPQIVAVYDDGLHLDFFTVTDKNLSRMDGIKVLHDPDGLLADYQQKPQALSSQEVINHFDSFCFTLIEFEAAYRRHNLLWASRLASQLSGEVAFLLCYQVSPETSMLGFKNLDWRLDTHTTLKMASVLDRSGPSWLPRGVKELFPLFENTARKIEAVLDISFNWAFFDFVKAQILALPTKHAGLK